MLKMLKKAIIVKKIMTMRMRTVKKMRKITRRIRILAMSKTLRVNFRIILLFRNDYREYEGFEFNENY